MAKTYVFQKKSFCSKWYTSLSIIWVVICFQSSLQGNLQLGKQSGVQQIALANKAEPASFTVGSFTGLDCVYVGVCVRERMCVLNVWPVSAYMRVNMCMLKHVFVVAHIKVRL